MRILIRFLIYPVILLVIAGFVLFITSGQIAANSIKCMDTPSTLPSKDSNAIDAAKAMSKCLVSKNGYVANLLTKSMHTTIKGLPNSPCKFVGTWESVRHDGKFKLSLHENGSFEAETVKAAKFLDPISGMWGVSGKSFVWLANEGIVWPPDINPIEKEGTDTFTLIEKNGTKSNFAKVADLARECGSKEVLK